MEKTIDSREHEAFLESVESDSILDVVIQNLPVGVSITDGRTGRALFHNKAIDALVERSVSDRTSFESFSSYGAIHADGRPYQIEDYPTVRSAKYGQTIVNEEMLYRRKDGKISTFAVSSTPVFGADGKPQIVLTTTYDLTARKELESKLCDSQHELEEIIRSCPVPMVLYRGPEHVYSFANPAHEKLVESRVLGRKFEEARLSKSTEKTKKILDQVYQTGRSVELKEEHFQIHTENHHLKDVYLDVGFYPFRDSQDQVVGVLGVAQDVTDHVKAKEAAQTQGKWLEILFNYLPVPVMLLNPDTGEPLFSNEATRKLPFPTRVNDPKEETCFTTDMSGEKVPPHQIPRIRIARGEIIRNEEYVWHTPRGSFPIMISGQRMPSLFGRPPLASVVIQDLSHIKRVEKSLRESETRFKKIFESNLIGVVFGDIEGRLYDVNDYYAHLIGTSREDVKAGKVRWDLITPPDELKKEMKILEEMRDSETRANIHYEKRYVLQNGREVWVQIGSSFLDEERKKTVAYVLDITRRKEAEAKLHQTLQQLQEAVKARDEEKKIRERFVMSLSHDLRTPISAAKMSAEILQNEIESQGDVSELIKLLVRNVDRADQMIRDLLDANRLSAGEGIPIEVKECDLRSIADEALRDLKLIYGDRFVLQAPENLKGFWSCSGVRRIIENLCSNAVKYGAPEKPVTVSIGHFGTRVEIQIHNEGPPISSEEQTSLFELFHRTQTAVRSRQYGWGVGLMLVKGLSEAHRGSVTVSSSSELGTTFTVSLPIDARVS